MEYRLLINIELELTPKSFGKLSKLVAIELVMSFDDKL